MIGLGLLAALALAGGEPQLEGSTTLAQIDFVTVLEFEGDVMVYVWPEDGVTGNTPACHSPTPLGLPGADFYTFKMSRPAADQFMKLLLQAIDNNLPVQIWGTGKCGDLPHKETVNFMRLSRYCRGTECGFVR